MDQLIKVECTLIKSSWDFIKKANWLYLIKITTIVSSNPHTEACEGHFSELQKKNRNLFVSFGSLFGASVRHLTALHIGASAAVCLKKWIVSISKINL